MSRLAPLSAAVAATALLAVAGGGAAVAKPIDHGTIHNEFSFTVTDYCGVAGLDIDLEVVNDIHFRVGSRGDDQLPYVLQHVTGHQTLTNPDNDRFVTISFRVVEKDLKVTDDGEAFTILVLATGNDTLYGMDGKALARNPGQSRWEILVDHNDTPQDPTDDEFVEFLGDVKGSTGRTDDYCAAAVPALT